MFVRLHASIVILVKLFNFEPILVQQVLELIDLSKDKPGHTDPFSAIDVIIEIANKARSNNDNRKKHYNYFQKTKHQLVKTSLWVTWYYTGTSSK